jgi:hypothetical protein
MDKYFCHKGERDDKPKYSEVSRYTNNAKGYKYHESGSSGMSGGSKGRCWNCKLEFFGPKPSKCPICKVKIVV